jgi:N-acetylglutamate synthase-like GNAT family acetyltransferase
MERARCGIGAYAAGDRKARRLKVPRLFLWTSSAEGLYLKLGWQPVERTDYCGTRIVIMENDFTTSNERAS